ncbi:MAG TPA: 5'-nucleosidase [Steroidobacteraceae bacterium]|jgi:adenosylhomocysteine nucleosidase|nr:5'-nucleosidase [Steroidobacteraceae bacterium]
MVKLPPIIVVMALKVESAGVFETAGVPVLFCGVGKVNAAIALMKQLSRYAHIGQPMPLVVNFGSAGSRCHPSGMLLACREFVQRDMDVGGLGFALGVTPYDEAPPKLIFDPVFTGLPAAVCGSGDSFATTHVEVACEVIDMEAYALAKVCRHEKARFACAKHVTDGADHAAAEDWQRNVHKSAEEFLRLFRGIEIPGAQ